MTYLRAPWTMFIIIAYLSFSARRLFLIDFVLSSRNVILKIDTWELNKQTKLETWDLKTLTAVNPEWDLTRYDFDGDEFAEDETTTVQGKSVRLCVSVLV